MLLAAAWLACAGAPREPQPAATYVAPPPSSAEQYCAWFGDVRGDTLFFGQSAFWPAYRAAGGDPLADLEHAGPLLVGRFDLARETLLPPLDLGEAAALGGVWDVLAHPNGRVYFTTYFDAAGWVDPASGAVRRLPGVGAGLNEIALAPDGSLVVSRYPAPDGGAGAIVILEPDGALRAEHPLEAPDGWIAAPKSVAVDPERGDIWITMDLLPEETGPEPRHDAYVLDAGGRLLRRVPTPEIQFVVFAGDGTGYRAEVEDGVLALRVAPPGAGAERLDAGRRVVLDPAFPEDLDFAQEVRLARDGRAVVTRWSGQVHLVGRTGGVRSLRLPRIASDALYYTAVLRDGRVCATVCAGVTVVCADAP